MNRDVIVISAVLNWTFGLLAVVVIGLALPFFLSVVPDAIAAFRRERDWKSLVQMSALAVGSAVLGVYFLFQTGATGAPSLTVWGVLAVLLAVAASSALTPMTVVRAIRRRSAKRVRDRALDEPLPSLRPDQDQLPPPPAPREEPLHWRQAEFLAAEWLRHLGAVDVKVTPERRDGGVDVATSDAFVQVKCLERDLIGVKAVRELVGVAAPLGRRALFFSTTSLTSDAQQFARDTNTALFVMRPVAGKLVPIGPLAQAVLRNGLIPEFRRLPG
jgi:hypothetical protein